MYNTIMLTPTECLQCARYNSKLWIWQPKVKDSNVTEPGSQDIWHEKDNQLEGSSQQSVSLTHRHT